jgi:hypothetical protein
MGVVKGSHSSFALLFRGEAAIAAELLWAALRDATAASMSVEMVGCFFENATSSRN